MRHVAFGAAAASTLVLFGAACDSEDGFEPGPCDEARNVDISEQLSDCTILNEGSLYIGALLPLSGMSAEFGVGLQTPINMAVEDVNEVGGIGGQCLGVVLCDTELDNAAGSSSTADRVEELASIDRVIGISGPYTPTDYFSAAERIQALDMPLVAVAPFQNMGGSVFNLSPQPMQSNWISFAGFGGRSSESVERGASALSATRCREGVGGDTSEPDMRVGDRHLGAW